MKEKFFGTIAFNVILGILLITALLWQEFAISDEVSIAARIGFSILGGFGGSFFAEIVKPFITDHVYNWERMGIGGAVASVVGVVVAILI